MEAVSTAVKVAAREAATGAWLAEFESGATPRIAALGLTHGLFGAWQEPDRANGVVDEQPDPASGDGAVTAADLSAYGFIYAHARRTLAHVC